MGLLEALNDIMHHARHLLVNLLMLVKNIIVQVEAVNKSQDAGECWRGLFGELEGSQRIVDYY